MKYRCTFKKQFAALLNIIHNQRWAVVHPKRRRKPPLTKTSFLKLSSKPNSMSSSGNMTETAVEHSIKTKQLSYSMMLSKDPIKRCHKKTSRLLQELLTKTLMDQSRSMNSMISTKGYLGNDSSFHSTINFLKTNQLQGDCYLNSRTVLIISIFIVMGGCITCARPGCFKKNKDEQETQDGKIFLEGNDIGMRINQAFKKYDKDKSGALSREQTRQFLMDMFKQQNKPFTEEQVQKFIKAADKNHDGYIQKKQLYNLYKKMWKEASAK